MEQRMKGTLEIWANSFTLLRVPKVFHLRRDRYERADVSPTPITTGRCREPIFASLYSRAGASLCREIPGDLQNVSPRQKPASFTVGGQMEALEKSLVAAAGRERLAPANSRSAGRRQCPLWVICGHTDKSAPYPLYPQ